MTEDAQGLRQRCIKNTITCERCIHKEKLELIWSRKLKEHLAFFQQDDAKPASAYITTAWFCSKESRSETCLQTWSVM